MACAATLAQDTIHYQKKAIVSEVGRLILHKNYDVIFKGDSISAEGRKFSKKQTKRTDGSLFIFNKNKKIIYYEKKK